MLGALGSGTLATLAFIGGCFEVLRTTLGCWLRARLDLKQFFLAMVSFGEKSIGVVLATAAFAGMIMVLQSAIYVKQYGVYDLVGWYSGFTTFREIGPILIALIFSGRVGASHTSELATMKVSEQLDALRILAIDAYSYIIAPRILAMVLSLIALVAFGDIVSVFSGAFVAKVLMGIEPGAFFRSLLTGVTVMDFGAGILKSILFAISIGIIGSYCALASKPGARGVGHAVNIQVVASAVTVFVIDYAVILLGTGF